MRGVSGAGDTMVAVAQAQAGAIGIGALEGRRVADLVPNPLNPRGPVVEDDELRELAASIAEQGVLQPLVVTPAGLILAGHRRHAAARLAGLETVPCVVRQASAPEQIALMLAENMHRKDLSPIRIAEAYQRLGEAGLTNSEIARMVGKTGTAISRYRDLLRLPEDVRSQVGEGRLPVWTAIAIARFAATPDVMRRVLGDTLKYGLTARAIDALDANGEMPKPNRPPVTFPMAPIHPDDFTGGHTFEDARLAERSAIAEYVRELARQEYARDQTSGGHHPNCPEPRRTLYELARAIDEGRHAGAEQRADGG